MNETPGHWYAVFRGHNGRTVRCLHAWDTQEQAQDHMKKNGFYMLFLYGHAEVKFFTVFDLISEQKP